VRTGVNNLTTIGWTT